MKILNVMKEEFFLNWKTKSFGFYTSIAAFVATLILLFTYPNVPEQCFNSVVILLSVLGVVLYVLFSQLRQTSVYGSLVLMIINFSSLMAMINADGFIDYISTAFFSGVSLEAFFALPVSLWLSILMMVFGFLIASVSLYMPQNKKMSSKNEDVITGGNN